MSLGVLVKENQTFNAFSNCTVMCIGTTVREISRDQQLGGEFSTPGINQLRNYKSFILSNNFKTKRLLSRLPTNKIEPLAIIYIFA